MKHCIIPALREPVPCLNGRAFNPEKEPFCIAHGFNAIDCFVWDETGYCPDARAYAAWDETGLHALLCAKEETIATAATGFGGDVYKDSCLEWFVQPFANDPRYINVEVNAAGAAYIGFGSCREDSKPLPAMPESMTITASKHEGGWWAIAYTIPAALLDDLYGRKLQPGMCMRGNFYKCDESIHPHFGSWSPISHPFPDFHRPEFFADMALESKPTP